MKLELQMELTDHDKKLLHILIVILLLVAFIFLGIKPLASNFAELKSQYEVEKQLAQENEIKVNKNDSLAEQTALLGTDASEIMADYYSLMSSDEIDQLLTEMVLNRGLTAKSLSITMPEEAFDLDAYKNAEISEESVSSVSLIEELYGVSLSQNTTENADSSSNTALSNDFYAATATMDIQGDKDELGKLINLISEQYPSIRITSYQWGTESNVTLTEDLTSNVAITDSLSMTLEIYMYDRKEE